jgi:hypothetical protein
MKKNDFYNKDEKLYRNLHKGVEDLKFLIEISTEETMKYKDFLISQMTDKEMERHKAFVRKVKDLLDNGKNEEAKELRKRHNNE